MASANETSDLAVPDQTPKILQDLKDCIRALLEEFKDAGIPITDDNVTLHSFWERFEFLMESELKDKSGLLSSRKSYWDYFCKCLFSKKFVHEGLRYVKSVNEFKTSLGRGRGFIRFCLMNKCLADSLQQCFQDNERTREFFKDNSLLLHSQYRSILLTSLYDLNEIQFDLSPVGHDLDVGWPTFSKKLFGVSYDWNVPSRTVSLTSLMSQSECGKEENVSQSDRVRGTLYDVEEHANEHSDSINVSQGDDLNGKSSENGFANELLIRIENLEHEKSSLNTDLEELRNQLTAKVKEVKLVSEQFESQKQEDLANKLKTNKELEWLRVEVKRLSDENIRLDENNTQLTEQIGKWKKCFGACTEKLSAKEKINESLEKQVRALKEVAEAAKAIAAVRADETDKLRALVSELKTRNAGESAELGTSEKSQMENENIELKSNVDKLVSNVENLKRMLDDKADELRQKDNAILEMGKIIEGKEVMISELENRNLQTEDSMKQLTIDNDTLKLNIKNLKVVAKEIESAENELEKLENDAKAFQDNHHKRDEDDDTNPGTSSDFTVVNFAVCEHFNAFPEYFVFNKTLRRLRSLITEKQDFQIKLKSDDEINSSLISRVKEQETKLSSVASELSQTKILLEQLKSAHNKLQTSEAILHYELKEKRSVVEQMKRVLETTRSQWLRVRQKQSESEIEWQNLRADFANRAKQESMESGFTEESNVDKDRTEPLSPISLQSPSTSSADIPALSSEASELEPLPLQASSPVTISENEDLSISQADDEEDNSDAVSVPPPTSKTRMRLQIMEEQCRLLYSRLVVSLKKSEFLEWKLGHLHEEHGGEPNTGSEASTSKENKTSANDLVKAKYDIIFVPCTDDNSKKPCDIPNDSEINFELNETEAENLQEKSGDDLCTIEENSMVEEANVINDPEINESLPLQLAQSLPRRVELLRKAKEDLERHLKQLQEDQKELEARETVRGLEVVDLRATIEELERSVQRLESEKLFMMQKEVEFKKRASYLIKKDREEKDGRYDCLLRDKEEVEEKLENVKNQLEDEISKCKQWEEDYYKCLNDLESNKQEALSLRYQLSTETIKHEEVMKKSEDHETNLNETKDVISKQEQVILELENQLRFIREEREFEKEQQKKELELRQMSLTSREEECAVLNEDLKKATKLLDENNKNIQQLSANLVELKAENNKLHEENDLCKSDCGEIKQKLVQLVKDKDLLWKRNEQLSFFHKMQTSDRWLQDDEVSHCCGCRAEFSMFLRKHHCRWCGRIFCRNCSSNFKTAPSHSGRVRICNECIDCHHHLDSSLVNKSNTDDSPDNSGTSSNTVETEEDENSVTSAIHDEGNRDALSAVSTGSSKTGLTSSRSETSLLDRLFSSFSHSPRSKSVLDEDDEDFYVITDEDISSSLSNFSPYAPAHNTDPRATVDPVQNISDLVNESKASHTWEIWINAGRSHLIPIKIDNIMKLTWVFTSEPKSIAFSLAFDHKNEIPDPEFGSTCLIQLTHCNAHLHPIQGKLIARRKGIYTFCFDNMFSRFIAKKLIFTITFKDEMPNVEKPISDIDKAEALDLKKKEETEPKVSELKDCEWECNSPDNEEDKCNALDLGNGEEADSKKSVLKDNEGERKECDHEANKEDECKDQF